MEKKGFVLYFDTYPIISALPRAQQGELFLAIYEYALSLAEGRERFNEILKTHKGMDRETGMAFRFFAETVRRDTEKWRVKHDRYAQAARERSRVNEPEALRQYAQEIRSDQPSH